MGTQTQLNLLGLPQGLGFVEGDLEDAVQMDIETAKSCLDLVVVPCMLGWPGKGVWLGSSIACHTG